MEIANVRAGALLEMRQIVNLKYFDEQVFLESSNEAFNKAVLKAVKKYRPEFEK